MRLVLFTCAVLLFSACDLLDPGVKDEKTGKSYYLTPDKVFSGATEAKKSEKQHTDMLNELDKIAE